MPSSRRPGFLGIAVFVRWGAGASAMPRSLPAGARGGIPAEFAGAKPDAAATTGWPSRRRST